LVGAMPFRHFVSEVLSVLSRLCLRSPQGFIQQRNHHSDGNKEGLAQCVG
jgi:hypothetical protein